jgi:hypothetical protein
MRVSCGQIEAILRLAILLETFVVNPFQQKKWWRFPDLSKALPAARPIFTGLADHGQD